MLRASHIALLRKQQKGDKTAHYHKLPFPDITHFHPQQHYTLNIEATERLEQAACAFVGEHYSASGRLWELQAIIIGPSLLQALIRDINRGIAKLNTMRYIVMLFHKRNAATAF